MHTKVIVYRILCLEYCRWFFFYLPIIYRGYLYIVFFFSLVSFSVWLLLFDCFSRSTFVLIMIDELKWKFHNSTSSQLKPHPESSAHIQSTCWQRRKDSNAHHFHYEYTECFIGSRLSQSNIVVNIEYAPYFSFKSAVCASCFLVSFVKQIM